MSIDNNIAPKAGEVLQLLLRASHLIKHEFETQLATIGLPFQISGPQLRLLLTVWQAESIRMNELAIKLGVKARTVTEHVDTLEREGLITRIPAPDDRRATLLELTEKALPHVEYVRAAQEQISECLLQNLSMEQKVQLYELLTQFFDNTDFNFVC